ncbi:MAG: hypothetical protein QG594_2280 [Bacteroidota bacterium]|nr:hypothetical protein [Bacteroidota bacterium]
MPQISRKWFDFTSSVRYRSGEKELMTLLKPQITQISTNF